MHQKNDPSTSERKALGRSMGEGGAKVRVEGLGLGV